MAEWSFLTNHAQVLLCIAHDRACGCGTSRLSQVKVITGLPFWRQVAGISRLCELDGLPGVAEFDGDGDGVDGDVDGAELGAVVVAVFAEPFGDRGGGSRCWRARLRSLSRRRPRPGPGGRRRTATVSLGPGGR
jgi:hypothetical protein